MLNIPNFKEGIIFVLWIIAIIFFVLLIIDLGGEHSGKLLPAGLALWLTGSTIARFAKP